MNYLPSIKISVLVLYLTAIFDLTIISSVKVPEHRQTSFRKNPKTKFAAETNNFKQFSNEHRLFSVEGQNKIPDLNKLPPEHAKVCVNDGKKFDNENPSITRNESSRSVSLTSRKEMLKKESRRKKYQRRLEKQNLLPAEEKEAIRKEINERAKRYREKNKAAIGFTSLRNSRIHHLKILQHQGKASAEQIKEVLDHTENVRRVARERSARKKAVQMKQKGQ